MARDPEHELAAARSRYEGNDVYGSLRHLDRARAAFTKRGDTPGLERVLEFAQLADLRDERGRAVRDNLVYAIKQNIRGTTRRTALGAKQPWVDPYPDLSAPQEHTRIPMTRGLKFWIGVGVGLGSLAIAAYFAAIIALAVWGGKSGSAGSRDVGLRIHNDTGRTVVIKWCATDDCGFDVFAHDEIAPGLSAEEEVPSADLVDELVIYAHGHKVGCLPVRTHDGYRRLRDKAAEMHVSVSQMSTCPGDTVVPSAEAPS